MKSRNAFTLAETIMTLFIVGLVVTAAIPMFTTKHGDGTAGEVSTPWGYCEIDDTAHIKNGLCGVMYPDATKLANSSVVIGNNDGDETYKNYDLSVYNLQNSDNMYDIFRSDKRKFRVGNYAFEEDRTNLYILNENIEDSVIPVNGTSNVLIGHIAPIGVGNVNNLQNSVLVGINNSVRSGINNAVVVGNNNTITADNSTLFGQNLAGNGGIKIGKNLNNALAGSVQIGFGTDAGGVLNHNEEFNINDMIFGTSGAGLTFYTNVNLTGTLTANTLAISDERLKNVKGAYSKGLKEILQVEPVVFKYKGQSTKNIGVIAQDLQKIFPEAVVTMPDGYLGVNNDPVFFAMLNAMKEVNQNTNEEIQRQETLQKELKELQSEIETLTACKKDDFWSKVRCFFYDAKMFVKSLIATVEWREKHEKV